LILTGQSTGRSWALIWSGIRDPGLQHPRAGGAEDPDPADINGNGTVDVIDFLALLADWGPCP
jgi:hypothetical protein